MLVRTGGTNPQLAVLDVVDSVTPRQLCVLSPADGGRFVSATRIAFWHGQTLGSADLASVTVGATGSLRGAPSDGAFSSNGSAFAYHVMSSSGGWTTHLNLGSDDRTLITVGPIGGHGGPPYGPLAQLEFSRDGNYLLDYQQFIPRPGPPQFAVYRTDGSMAFQSDRAEFGAWAPTGATIYFLVTQQPGGDVKGDLHSWDPSAGDRILVRGLTSYFWPRTAPDGKTVAFNAYDTTAPGPVACLIYGASIWGPAP